MRRNFRHDLRLGIGIADHSHHGRRLFHVLIKRQQRQNGLGGPSRSYVVQPDQAPGVGFGREVGIDDHEFVPVPHGSEHAQQIRAQERINPFQHGGISMRERGGMVSHRCLAKVRLVTNEQSGARYAERPSGE